MPSSPSNSSVLYLCASNMMHCVLRFKYHNFSHLVVSSTEFGEVTVKVPFLPASPGGGRYCILHFTRLLPWQSRVSAHNLTSRVRAIECMQWECLTNFNCLFSTNLLVYRKKIHGRVLSIRVFSADGHCGLKVSLRGWALPHHMTILNQ